MKPQSTDRLPSITMLVSLMMISTIGAFSVIAIMASRHLPPHSSWQAEGALLYRNEFLFVTQAPRTPQYLIRAVDVASGCERITDYPVLLPWHGWLTDGDRCWIAGGGLVIELRWIKSEFDEEERLVPLSEEPRPPSRDSSDEFVRVIPENQTLHLIQLGSEPCVVVYRVGFEFVTRVQEIASALAPENVPPDVTGWTRQHKSQHGKEMQEEFRYHVDSFNAASKPICFQWRVGGRGGDFKCEMRRSTRLSLPRVTTKRHLAWITPAESDGLQAS